MPAERTDEEIAREIAWSADVEGRLFSERHAERQRLADAIASALRTARAQGVAEGMERQWRPIETAPTNTSILVWVPHYHHYGPGVIKAILVDMGTGKRWHSTGWHVGRDIPEEDWPTRWMPLPSSPAPKDEAV